MGSVLAALEGVDQFCFPGTQSLGAAPQLSLGGTLTRVVAGRVNKVYVNVLKMRLRRHPAPELGTRVAPHFSRGETEAGRGRGCSPSSELLSRLRGIRKERLWLVWGAEERLRVSVGRAVAFSGDSETRSGEGGGPGSGQVAGGLRASPRPPGCELPPGRGWGGR